MDLTGHGKGKEKVTKEGKKEKESKGRTRRNSPYHAMGNVGVGSEDVDCLEAADLVAILADQVVKDEIKRLRPGFKSKKKGAKPKKKISEFFFCFCFTDMVRLFFSSVAIVAAAVVVVDNMFDCSWQLWSCFCVLFISHTLICAVRRTLGRPDELQEIEQFNQSSMK